MQAELRGVRQGRRYFGRDITNIEDINPKPQSKLLNKPAEKSNQPPFQQPVQAQASLAYRPLSSGLSSRGPSQAGGLPEPSREYAYPNPAPRDAENRHLKPTGRNATTTPIHALKVSNKMVLEKDTSPHKPFRNELQDSEDRQPKFRPSKERSASPMLLEKIDLNPTESYPDLPFLLKDADSVYKFNKQMNFPGSDFVDFQGIPYSCIWSHLIFKRSDNVCLSFYLEHQTDITQDMYEIVIDWLVDVHRKFKMKNETLFLCITLMNKYLEKNEIKKEIFQLLATTCMFISSKYEEIYPPPIEDFVYICADAYTKNDFINMEAMLLCDVEFNLVFSNPITLLGIYGQQSKHALT
jgi:hypothetical protein